MSVASWLDEIQKAEKREKVWRSRADKIISRYEDERNAGNENDARFNILWSNTETLKPALYSNTPKPIIDRRYKDKDPIGIQASRIVERALEYHLDAQDFDGEMKSCVEDYLLPARGVARVRYEPTYGQEETPDGGEPFSPVVYEQAVVDYVHWKDFLHGPGRRWGEVQWISFTSYLERDELVDRFGKIGGEVPLDHKPEDEEDTEGTRTEKATVYEVWCKKSKTVKWIAKEYKHDFLEVAEPPIKFDNFWPCPAPLYGGKTNKSLIPIPLYIQYQDQADELDSLTRRIAVLTSALRVAGVYDSSVEGLQRVINDGCENELIPVENWPAYAKSGGFSGAIDFIPIAEVANVLIGLYEARDKVKQDLYEITGMSDIMRGTVDPREKMGQSRLKAQYATLRMSDRQKEVARFARDLLQLMAEVIAEQFSPQTLTLMTGQEVPEEVINLLRNDPIRNFRIDLETDSTVEPDQQAEKEARIEFLTAAGSFLERALTVGDMAPNLTPLLGEMLMFGVKGFGVSRDLEGAFEDAKEAMSQQQPPQENQEERMKEEMQAQAEAGKQQIEQGKLQLDAQEKQQNAQFRERELEIKEREVAIKERDQAVKETELAYTLNEQKQNTEREIEEHEEMKAQEMQALQAIVDSAKATAQPVENITQALEQQSQALQEIMGMLCQIGCQMSAPKRIVKDENGRPIGVETVLDS